MNFFKNYIFFSIIIILSNCNNPFLPSSLINNNRADKNYSFIIELKYQWTGSVNNPSSNQIMHTPIIADINQDKIPDIIFNTFIGVSYNSNGTIRVISGNTGEEIFSILTHQIKPCCNPAVGDIDNDNLPEILAVADSGKIVAFENNGIIKWESEHAFLPAVSYAGISLSNIDHSGFCEIIAGNWVLNNDGSTKWHGTLGSGKNNSCTANLDLSGGQEIIAGNTTYYSDGSI